MEKNQLKKSEIRKRNHQLKETHLKKEKLKERTVKHSLKQLKKNLLTLLLRLVQPIKVRKQEKKLLI